MRSLAGGALFAALLIMGSTSALAAGGALQFDGTNDYVTFGADTVKLGLTSFTIELWFYRTGTGATASTGTGGVTAVPLFTKGRGEADGDNRDMNYFLGIRGTDNVLCADYEEGTGQTSPGSTIRSPESRRSATTRGTTRRRRSTERRGGCI